MTSKNLCFKLMAEDLKRRVWTIAWSILSMFFAQVVPVALACGDYRDKMAQMTDVRRNYVLQKIAGLLHSNYWLVLVLLITAVLWAVSGFHYLHNSRKTDFYHSLPVKRRQLFMAVCLNGILIPAVCCLAAEMISVFIVLQTGIGAELFGNLPWQSLFLNMAYYCLMYATVVVAMMMTGNVVVAILGTGVFCGYGPAVTALVFGYCEVWFHTFYEYWKISDLMHKLVRYTSPLSNYIFALTHFSRREWALHRGVLVLLTAAALVLLAYGLYRMRTSESAGRAMAFEKTKAPIRILLTVPVSIVAGLFFYELRTSSVGWMIFGTVCGAVLTHCLMEIIYHFDFRKLFSHKIQLAVCSAACLLIALAGYYDWYGYDSWIPEADEVESAALSDNHDSWVTHGSPAQEMRYGLDPEYYYYWQYESDHEFKNMRLTDLYPVIELAREGVDQVKLAGSEPAYHSGWSSLVIMFRMKNGKEVYRRYYVPTDGQTGENLDAIHDSMEYKAGKYPILSQTAEETAGIYFQQYNRVSHPDMDQKEIARLLEAFQKDISDMDIETRKNELPVATIQFRTYVMEEAIEYNSRNVEWSDNIVDRCYYPVLPSFTRTLQILKENGIEPETPDSNILERIRISYDRYNYPERAEAGLSEAIEITDPAEIDELSQGLCYSEYYTMNAAYQINRASANVSVKMRDSGHGTEYDDASYLPFVIDLNKLPPEAVEKYGFKAGE